METLNFTQEEIKKSIENLKRKIAINREMYLEALDEFTKNWCATQINLATERVKELESLQIKD